MPLGFCGLDREPAVLQFNETERTVTTVSYRQVRRPVYSSPVGRWKHCARHLEPLRVILDD